MTVIVSSSHHLISYCLFSSRALVGSSAELPDGVVGDFLQQETGHLTQPQLTYFSHWLLLCCLEAATMETKNGRKRVWLQTTEEKLEAFFI